MENRILASVFILIGVIAVSFQAYVMLNLRYLKLELADQGVELSSSMVLLITVSDFISAYWYLTIFAAMIPIAIGISILSSKSQSNE